MFCKCEARTRFFILTVLGRSPGPYTCSACVLLSYTLSSHRPDYKTNTHTKKQNIWKALNFRYIYKWYFWKYKHYSKMNFTSGQEMQPIWYHRACKTPSMISGTIDTGCHSACLWSRRQTQEDRKVKLAPGYLAQDQSGIHQSLSWKRNRILPRFWLFVVLLPGNLKSHV